MRGGLGGEVVQEPLPVSIGVVTPSSTSGEVSSRCMPGEFLCLHPNVLELVQLVREEEKLQMTNIVQLEQQWSIKVQSTSDPWIADITADDAELD